MNLNIQGDYQLVKSTLNRWLVLLGTSTPFYKAQYSFLFARLQLQETLHFFTRWSECAVLCATFVHLLFLQNININSSIVHLGLHLIHILVVLSPIFPIIIFYRPRQNKESPQLPWGSSSWIWRGILFLKHCLHGKCRQSYHQGILQSKGVLGWWWTLTPSPGSLRGELSS